MKTKILTTGILALTCMCFTSYTNAAVTVTHNPNAWVSYTLNWNEHFTAWIITITDWKDTITILDRNLWATAAWTGCEDPNFWTACAGWDPTYWYHFQRWNNYWFDPMDNSIITNSVTTKATWLPEYSNKWYFWSVFIKATGWPYDYWSDNENHYDLWWWRADDVPNYDNNWIWKVTDWTDRKWPCPENFHVPSYWELAKLWSMFNNSVDEIHKNLLLPFAGYRGFNDAIVYNLWSWANVDTSSPSYSYSSQIVTSYNKWTSLWITGAIGIWTAPRTNAVSIRCFYDSYTGYTSDSNSKILVNIAALNWWQNTCTGQDFVFSFSASPTEQVQNLVKTFECIFWNSASKAVVLHLSGNLVDENWNIIPWANVKLKNSEWINSPNTLWWESAAITEYKPLTWDLTLFNKVANKIWVATWAWVDIQVTVPAWAPDGVYNGVLILDF